MAQGHPKRQGHTDRCKGKSKAITIPSSSHQSKPSFAQSKIPRGHGLSHGGNSYAYIFGNEFVADSVGELKRTGNSLYNFKKRVTLIDPNVTNEGILLTMWAISDING